MSLASANRIYGDGVMQHLVEQISLVNDAYNAGIPMTPVQVGECAGLIYEDFHFLKISEIQFIFKQAKKGVLGKVQRMNMATIYGWVNDYATERHELTASISQDEAKENNANLEHPIMENDTDFYAQFAKGVPTKPPVTPKMKYKPMGLDEKGKLIREWQDLEDKGGLTMEQYVTQKLKK